MSTAAKPVTLGSELLKRVTYSKHLLNRAKELRRRGGELNTAEAILAAHDSAEMLMRVVTDFLGASSNRQDFMAFWEAVAAKASEPPNKGQMDRFNKVRTEFKHRGILPNISVASELLPIVESFCGEISRIYLGIDYDALSLADLIQSSAVREKVKEAEAAKDRSDISTAITCLGFAFDELLFEARRKHKRSLLEYDDWSPHISDHRLQQVVNGLKIDQISKGVKAATNTINMMLLGIDPLGFREFSEITPLRQHMADGSATTMWTTDPNSVTSDAYEMAYQFVLDSALRISS